MTCPRPFMSEHYFGVELEDVFYRAEQPPAHGDDPEAEDGSADTSGEAGDHLRQRPQARDVLNALLDLRDASIDELERRSGLTASVVGHEVSVLKDLGLVQESVQPGPVFGRPHTTAFSLTEEGRNRIVEFHRNL